MTRLIDASEIRAMMSAHARGKQLDVPTFCALLADDIEQRLNARRGSVRAPMQERVESVASMLRKPSADIHMAASRMADVLAVGQTVEYTLS